MKFDCFLKLLPKISKELSPKEYSMLNALQSMISQYFEPAYKEIMKRLFFESIKSMVNSRLEDKEILELRQVNSPLQKGT
jgi:hypothetical protein